LHSKFYSQLESVREELDHFETRYENMTGSELMQSCHLCIPEQSVHPYVKNLLAVRLQLAERLSEKSEAYYRSDDLMVQCYFGKVTIFSMYTVLQFDDVIVELQDFQASVAKVDMELEFSDVSRRELQMRQMQNFLVSAQNFVHNVLHGPLGIYRDIVEPFVLGVQLLRLGLSKRLFEHVVDFMKLETKNGNVN